MVLTKTNLRMNCLYKGKVRDTYEYEGELLMIATDRISAFDVVFDEGIPKKGEVLNKLSEFWFKKTRKVIRNHMITTDIPDNLPNELIGRSMIVKKCRPIMIECIVRGYLTGSGWKEYQKDGSICGIKLPLGLKNGSELPEPIFTPSTKAEIGKHDININEEEAIKKIGNEKFNSLKEKSIELYNLAKEHANKSGLILADTKFEFGEIGDEVLLIDEALTPDSSRYWIKEKYDEGILESMDKQYLRDYLEKLEWNKEPPAPKLPDEIIQKTSQRYLYSYKALTGLEL